MHDGCEATYSRFLVRGTKELKGLVAGKPVPSSTKSERLGTNSEVTLAMASHG
jgi:hypothetical protein